MGLMTLLPRDVHALQYSMMMSLQTLKSLAPSTPNDQIWTCETFMAGSGMQCAVDFPLCPLPHRLQDMNDCIQNINTGKGQHF